MGNNLKINFFNIHVCLSLFKLIVIQATSGLTMLSVLKKSERQQIVSSKLLILTLNSSNSQIACLQSLTKFGCTLFLQDLFAMFPIPT